MLNLSTVAPWLQNQGVYGPVTATLDWCEVRIRTLIVQIIKSLNHEQVNFQFSPYIAEMANTFSNLFPIALALCGGSQAMKERLPSRFPLGYAVRLFSFLSLSTNSKYMHLPKLTGRRSSWNRQFFLSCNPPLRSSTCRRASHDLRRLYESLYPL
jgi:hypothetical protein